MNPPIFRDIESLTAWRKERQDARVALVPTMGALHAGHLSLVDVAREHADKVLVSIFVNPTQFAAGEDLASYPRNEAADLAALEGAADGVYLPPAELMYPPDFATPLTPQGVALGLEAEARPHFFGGVATICAKLFLQTRADVAVFGEKDYQQLLVVQQLVRDLNINTKIIPAPIIREADGLAMSSRNVYLQPAERKLAAQLPKILKQLATSELDEAEATAALLAAGFDKVDYATIRDAQTLAAPTKQTRSRRALVAATINTTRLLDNMEC